MYLRNDHAEHSVPVLRDFIRQNPLGVLTTAIPSDKYPLLQASHIPWVLDVDDDTSETEKGVLRGHMARANPQSKAIIDTLIKSSTSSIPTDKSISSTLSSPAEISEADRPIEIDTSNASTPPEARESLLEQQVMVLFSHPAHSYVTPKFYTATKPTTGKVVPTWNYSAVQAYGRAKIYFDSSDPATGKFLSRQFSDLSALSERQIMGYTGQQGRPEAWRVDDAPEKYIEILTKAIIGVEIVIERLEGKFKMSQEMGIEDRQGVAEGFAALDTERAREVSRTVVERSEKWESRKRVTVKA